MVTIQIAYHFGAGKKCYFIDLQAEIGKMYEASCLEKIGLTLRCPRQSA
jgi:hypothetical protein